MTDLSITRGDSRTFRLTSVDFDGSPTDFTTYNRVWFTVKRALTDADSAAIVAKTLLNGITILSTDHSKLDVVIEPGDTSILTIVGAQLVLFYDLQTQDSFGNINTPQSGSFTITADITRAIG
jgi:hypothetical protein